MYNFHNRQYIFRQSDGTLWNFFCDHRQELCYSTLTERGLWSSGVVLHKNATRYFYVEMDEDDVFHLLFQTGTGNIHYSRLDGQSIRTVPVLNSKTPAVYNKQLYIAPLKDNVYLFYVLQHENSFMLAYQTLSSSRLGTPKVVDYVSGSSQPCSIAYDYDQNIYTFYQSYDGKYLQLGYKKFNTVLKHWSDFTPVTKYAGNCEYPHVIVDNNGIIHLCYQRRTPKLYEMVYQQKAPDRNLWSREIIVHSSVHSFENASILQVQQKIVVYWIRDDIIYFNSGSLDGDGWNKASRHITQFGRQLQCLCYKSNREGDVSPRGDISQLSPCIYPGTLSNGLKLAFYMGDISQFNARDSSSGAGTVAGSSISRLLPDVLGRLQEIVDEINENRSQSKKEMNRLANAYSDLKKEVEKYAIRLNMIEKQLSQLKRLPVTAEADAIPAPPSPVASEPSPASGTPSSHGSPAVPASPAASEYIRSSYPSEKVRPTLDPEKLKEWEEWTEPEELRPPQEEQGWAENSR